MIQPDPFREICFLENTNMEYKKRISIRLDERSAMLLNELSKITRTSTSIIIRGMVNRSIEELIDKSGNWKIPNEKDKEGKG